jgi:histone H3/H4
MDAVVQTHPPAAAAGEEPRDVRAVRKLLLSVGLREGQYDPRVVHQLVEVARRYTGDVLVDARAYANHAGRASVERDDVRLAIQAKSALFRVPPRHEVALMIFSLNSEEFANLGLITRTLLWDPAHLSQNCSIPSNRNRRNSC